MNRMLIVDNEDYVVDGLLEVFRQLSHLEIEAIGAYSAKEALDWLKRAKIDIIVSDIRMPGMDGLTLQKEIVRHWPNCKVIFLSGFNDFEYAQQAIRGGALDYVLKTDGDERLVEAVEKAVALLRDEIELEALIVKSKHQMKLASETLQLEFVRQLLYGERIGETELGRQFANLHIALQPGMPVLAIVGRVDEWTEGIGYYDRLLLLYSIRNIAGEYLNATVNQLSIPIDRYHVVWIIQPAGLHPASPERVRDDTWTMMTRFVQGTFELIQSACKDLIKLDLSVVMAEAAVGWQELGSKFVSLKEGLASGLGAGRQLLMIDQPAVRDEGRGKLVDATAAIGGLTSLLENHQREPFFEAFDELIADTDAERLEKHYYMVSALLLSFHRREMLLAGTGEGWDMARLIRPDLRQSAGDAARYLRQCCESVFDYRDRSRGESEDELIGGVKRIVAGNLAGELSLTGIAESVGHNASYLSRLFKQKTGVGVAEYIADCRIRLAKELLSDSGMRIQDISTAAGFASVQYFYRVFKKSVGMTPQEWRDATG
ncbi:response regulator [Cohnella sp. GCM10027633]|uniref:response regulator n=1 Tax=unclassified Cohnella TaxID=2636738 RepID=UPI00362A2F17